jgi:hypothetical protein
MRFAVRKEFADMPKANDLEGRPGKHGGQAGMSNGGSQLGTLYFKIDVFPDQIFQAIGRLRKEARDEIDRSIRFLDETVRNAGNIRSLVQF